MAKLNKKTKHIVDVYVKYFGRVATEDEIRSFDDVKTLSKITAEVRVNAANESGLKGSDYLNSIIQNLFGRSEANAFESKYAKKLDDNVYYNLPIATIIKKGSKDDKGVYNAKKLVAEMVATKGGSYELDNITQENYKSIYNVKTGLTVKTIDELEAKIVNVEGNINGKTFTLTEGVDSGKDFVGTAKNDLFSANAKLVIDPATGAKNPLDTIDSEDILDGGKGTDTLSIVTAVAATDAAPTLTDIENVNIKFQAASTIDLVNAKGVETVKVHNSTDAGTVAGIKTAAVVLENETKAIKFEGSTATALKVTATNVNDGTATPAVQVVSVDSAVADTATSLTLNVTDSMVDMDSGNNDAYTDVTINATGTNTVTLTDVAAVATKLTVTGKGSVDLEGAALTKVETVTVADGGSKIDMTANTATTLTVKTGAGEDTLKVTGTNLKSINTGAGNDSVTVTTALAATSVVTLGDGDDIVTLDVTPAAGATIDGGAGKDTIAMTKASYAAVSAFTTAEKALISGFETLQITDILTAAAGPYVVSTLSGVKNFVAADGVTNGETSAVTGLGANATVTIKGTATATGILSAALINSTGVADSITFVASNDYTENNDGTADAVATAVSFSTSGVENVTIESTGVASQTVTGTNKADILTNTITLVNNDVKSLVITGDKIADITTDNDMDALTVIDASANTAGVIIDASAADTLGISIKGSATAANTLTGTDFADKIIGGSGNDIITGGAKGDTMTGNGGNDKFIFAAGDSSIGTGAFDTITDFVANTKGNATAGSVTANSDDKLWTGDVLQFAKRGDGSDGVKVDVFTSAADATTFLANNTGAIIGANAIVAALDSAKNNLYVDNTGDGVADFYIHLTGVTTIDAAAFLVV